MHLARHLLGDHKTYDGEQDRIKLARTDEPKNITAIPQAYANPNPVIAQAQAAYKSALEAERRR